VKRKGLLKRNLAYLLAAVLALGIVSYVPNDVTKVQAEGTESKSAIMLGTSGIKEPTPPQNANSAWSGSYVYFGTYGKDANGNPIPLKYRVLDNETTVFSKTDSNGNEAKTMLLDCDTVLETRKFDSSSNVWASSDIRKYLNSYGDYATNGNGFLTSSFSTLEQAAIAESTVASHELTTDSKDGVNVAVAEWIKKVFANYVALEKDKVFLLDAEDVSNGTYGYSATDSYATNRKKTTADGNAAYWWLRSPDTGADNLAGYVDSYGIIFINYSVDYGSIGVSPALNINLSSVLFSSAAAGGKISTAVSDSSGNNTASLSEIGSYTGIEWKLTLKDGNRKFDVSENDVTGESGDVITLKYNGASVGSNEYVSIILEDSDSKFTHYGRVAQPTDAVGSLQFTLPSGLTDGKYTLHVFSEQYNGDYNTDYASEFDNVTLTVQNTTPIITNRSATRESELNATVKFTSSEAGTYYYEVVESSVTLTEIDTSGAGTACVQGENAISLTDLSGAGAKDMYIIVKDAAGNKSETCKVSIPEYVTQSEPASQDNSNETTSTESQEITETVTPEIVRSPKTGEDGTQILWGLTLIVSLSACLILIGSKCKKNNR
jgi:hypothetical protein